MTERYAVVVRTQPLEHCCEIYSRVTGRVLAVFRPSHADDVRELVRLANIGAIACDALSGEASIEASTR